MICSMLYFMFVKGHILIIQDYVPYGCKLQPTETKYRYHKYVWYDCFMRYWHMSWSIKQCLLDHVIFSFA